jgi:hypothetical protein
VVIKNQAHLPRSPTASLLAPALLSPKLTIAINTTPTSVDGIAIITDRSNTIRRKRPPPRCLAPSSLLSLRLPSLFLHLTQFPPLARALLIVLWRPTRLLLPTLLLPLLPPFSGVLMLPLLFLLLLPLLLLFLLPALLLPQALLTLLLLFVLVLEQPTLLLYLLPHRFPLLPPNVLRMPNDRPRPFPPRAEAEAPRPRPSCALILDRN